MRNVDPVFVRSRIQKLAEKFAENEKEYFEKNAKKHNLPLPIFLTKRLPGGVYCFITVNNDISREFLRTHLSHQEFVSLNNRNFDSFIRMVNDHMKKFVQSVYDEYAQTQAA